MARSVTDCVAMMDALVPMEPAGLETLEGIRVGVAWLEDADPGVSARVRAAAALFPVRAEIAFPVPDDLSAVFMREAADVHRDLFAAHRDLYGRNVRAKIERALQVTDTEYEAGRRERERYIAEAEEAFEDFDLLVVPTIGTVAPPVHVPESELRESILRFTRPFNILGWPALALPCGPAEHGLPASISLVGRSGADALVLAAGEAIEEALRPRPRG